MRCQNEQRFVHLFENLPEKNDTTLLKPFTVLESHGRFAKKFKD